MKKKFSLIFILVLFVFPSVVLASSSCTSTSISNNATSYTTASSGADCTYDCWWNSMMGVRFRIYSYDGSKYTALGEGIDVWGTSKTGRIYMSNAYYSNPNNDTLSGKTSSSCDTTATTSKMKLNLTTYDDYNIYIDESLEEASDKGTINSWILNKNKNGGWLYQNMYKLLTDNTTNSNESFEDIWGVSADTIRSSSDNIYIVAEILIKVYAKNSNISTFKDGYFYFGTVSEFAPQLGYSTTYRALGIQNVDIGKMVKKNGTGLIKYVDLSKVNSSFAAYGSGADINKKAACSYAYGMAIYHLATDCEECGETKCSDYDACGNITNGTSERRACAISWCADNDKDNSSCVSDCSEVTPDEGCDTTPGVCSTQKTTKTGDVCSSNSKVVVEKSVCYDDTTSKSILNDNNSVDLSSYVENLDIKYYRIDCTEKATLSNTANADTLLLTTTGTTDLYLGYTLGFYKTCTLTFKSTDGSSWVVDDYNQSKTSASSVSTSYDGDMRIITDIITYYHYCDSNSCTSEVKQKMQAYANALLDIYNKSKSRLDGVVATEYTSGTTNQAVIDVINSSMTSTSTVTVDLKPAYCESNTGTSGGTSSFSGDICYDGEKVTTTLSGSTSTTTCKDTQIETVTTNTSGTEKTYSYTYYFTLPSSYISYSTSNVYHNADDCDKDTKASNGFCVEVENAYSFAPFTSTVSTGSITSGDYTISFSNLGTCKLSYNYTCSYDLEDSSYCSSELAKYTYGTEDWQKAFDKYCSCDVYCGSNVACRMKYCPDECDECDELCPDDDPSCYKEKYCTLKDCEECGYSCEQETSTDEEYISCYFDNCCTAECDGNVGCINNCCTTECGCLYDTSSTEYKTCITACGCPEGGCPEGEEYYYRSIDMDNPFPDGIGSSREPGYNWYNKVEIITESNDADSDYYDATDGRDTSVYEYEIYLSSSDIEDIRDSGYSTTYIDPNYSKKYKSDISDKVYCSEFLHDYLSGLGITVKVGNLNSSKGCEA